MVSFFSHGFASGGESSKKGKKKAEEEGIWVRVVDGSGHMNWQHSVTGAFWNPFGAAPLHPVVAGGYPMQAVPMAQPVYPAQVNAWGVPVVPVSPVDGKKKKEKGGYWDAIRDKNGVRCYKHSRTNKIRYTDPYV